MGAWPSNLSPSISKLKLSIIQQLRQVLGLCFRLTHPLVHRGHHLGHLGVLHVLLAKGGPPGDVLHQGVGGQTANGRHQGRRRGRLERVHVHPTEGRDLSAAQTRVARRRSGRHLLVISRKPLSFPNVFNSPAQATICPCNQQMHVWQNSCDGCIGTTAVIFRRQRGLLVVSK